jgi:hypothetical protein
MWKMKDEFSLPVFLIGLFVGGFVSAFWCITEIPVQRDVIIQNACGTCQERGKICGEYVCSQDGWK